MPLLIKNNAFSRLAALLSNVATSLTVETGTGIRFPIAGAGDYFKVTLQDAANNIEIIKVTARAAASDSMTIERGQEGTTARAWNIGDVVELRLTQGQLAPLQVFSESATAADIRTVLDVPTRTGGDASGTWNISITGNAATSTNATNSTNVNVTAVALNAEYPLVLAPNATSGQKALLMDTAGGTYNPSTNTATISITGNAATAGTATNVSGGSASVTTLTASGAVALNNGTVTTTATNVSLFNATATTLNIGGAASVINIGAANTGTMTIGNNVIMLTGTGALDIPVGTTAQRPTASTGMIRFNTTITQFEGFNGTAWGTIGGGATGTGADQVFILNDQAVTANYTIPTGKNAGSFGTITINTGVTVTVPVGSSWAVV